MGFLWRLAVGDERIDRCGVASVTVNDKGSHAPLRAFPRRPSTSAWDPSAARTLQNMSANLVRRGPWHRGVRDRTGARGRAQPRPGCSALAMIRPGARQADSPRIRRHHHVRPTRSADPLRVVYTYSGAGQVTALATRLPRRLGGFTQLRSCDRRASALAEKCLAPGSAPAVSSLPCQAGQADGAPTPASGTRSRGRDASGLGYLSGHVGVVLARHPGGHRNA
jgi:hypothetical protein